MLDKAIYKKPLYEVRQIRNLKEMLEQSCSEFAGKPAFMVKSKQEEKYIPITYGQLKKDVDSLGTALIDLGLKGKRIALIGENRYEWAVAYLAVVNGSGVVVPIDRELPESEIESLLHRSEASAVFFSPKHAATIKEIAGKANHIKYLINFSSEEDKENELSFRKLVKKGEMLLGKGERGFLDAEIDNEAMNVLLFTSGTTAESKAVMLSHKNICADLMDMCSMVNISPEDIFLSVLPIHHTYECTCGFLCPIYRGCAIAYCEGLKHILKNLKESEATIMLSVPLILENIYKRIWEQASKKKGMNFKLRLALSISNVLRKVGIDIRKKLFRQISDTFGGHMRLLVSGAAGINPNAAKGFRDFGINIIQGYGLTECSPIVAVNRDVYFKDAAAGLPMPGVDIKIEQPMSDGSGEIVAKGPSVMMGYYKNQQATSEVLKDGWFYTGDLGYIDKQGFIHITGRKKDVIVTKNGKNIFPEEIEKILNESKYISESMIWGKPGNDGDTMICAVVVPDREQILGEGKEELTEEQVRKIIDTEIRKLNADMPIYRHIREFTIKNEELTKTTTKKIKRHIEIAKLNKK